MLCSPDERFRLNCELEAVANGYHPALGRIYSDILILVASGIDPERLKYSLLAWLGLFCPDLSTTELANTNNFLIDTCVDVFERLKMQ